MVSKHEWDKAWREKNREAYNRLQRSWQAANLDKVAQYGRNWRIKIKREAIDAYGGKCGCCGEGTFEFLCIDHVNGGGRKHRESIERNGGGSAIYRWLKKEGYPQDGRFRVLCHNCNMARAAFGRCPHEGGIDDGRDLSRVPHLRTP